MPENIVKHCFFLDLEQAYLEASKQHTVCGSDGIERLQYCYYDGIVTDIQLPNLIRLPVSDFAEFFSANELPIPSMLRYADGSYVDMSSEATNIINEILLMRKDSSLSQLPHKDSYFFDYNEALNTAKQQNQVNTGVHPTIGGLQLCYYHGEAVASPFKNLIHLPIDDFITFFRENSLRIPVNLVIPKDTYDAEFEMELISIFDQAYHSAINERNNYFNQLFSHYSQLLPQIYSKERLSQIIENYRKQHIKVFIITSYYTTFLQYCSRDIAHAFRQIGCEAKLASCDELSVIDLFQGDILRQVGEFQPDLTLIISHVRPDYLCSASCLPFVSYVQDLMPEFYNQAIVKRQTEFDFLYAYSFYDELKEIGYRDIKIIPVMTNEEIYQGEASNHDYLYDISYVNHAPMNNATLNKDEKLNSKLVKTITDALSRLMQDGRKFICTSEEYKDLIASVVQTDDLTESCYEEVRRTLGNYVYRSTILGWLLKQNYQLAIFGDNWHKYPDFAEVAQGPAKNGEPLANIFNRSKINLHIHPFNTTHPRVFDVIASAGFLLIGKLPQDKDLNPISNYLEEGEGYIFFDGREDLVNKINYYLQNREERLKIIEKGRQTVLSHYTYKVFCQDIMNRVIERLG